MRRFPLLARLLLLAALLPCFGLPACGSAAPADELPFTLVPPGGIGSPPSGGGPNVPPPVPPQTPTWSANAFLHGRTPFFGAFPSDLVRFGNTLFVSDADEITGAGASIVPIDVSGATPAASTTYAPTTISTATLRDSLGNPVTPSNPIGFGYFLNDLIIVDGRLGFVVVNAAGSDSLPTLSNVIAFDPSTGAVLDTFNLANPYSEPFQMFDSTGAAVPGNAFIQSGAEALAYLHEGPDRGLLYVAMSNLIFGAPSFGAEKMPGTVQVLRVDRSAPQVISTVAGGGLTTRTLRTTAFNPVALDVIQPRGGAAARLLVTAGGTTRLNQNFNLVPATPATVEAFDAQGGGFLGLFQLGLAGLVAKPTLGRDAAGQEVGFFASGVNGAVYLLWLDGLYDTVVNPSRLAVLRGPQNPIAITGGAGTPGGNITGVGLAPDGRTLAVAGFGDLFALPTPLPGRIFLLSLPEDLRTGAAFGSNFIPGRSVFASVPGRTLGGLVLVPNDFAFPDVYVNVGGPIDGNGLGVGPASLGALNTFGLVR